MPSKALALILILAPLPAAAFGNLDCITLETCTGDTCQPAQTPDPFSITFDWPNETATVEARLDGAAATVTLPWAATSDDTETPGTVLDYGAPYENATALRLIADGADITALYTLDPAGVETWVGTCDVRRAA